MSEADRERGASLLGTLLASERGGGDAMSYIPPPMGFPIGLAFDALGLAAALTTLVMLAGLAVLLWAARLRNRLANGVRPERRTVAVVALGTVRRRSPDRRRAVRARRAADADGRSRARSA
jgi:hypothetical protein